jgi:serine phosphatase RsbU (regulator of sigma subunit)
VTAVIADVAGKGVPAALMMSRVSSDFRRLARAGLSARALLAQLNQVTCEQATDEAFITAAVVCLDSRAGRLEMASAGHVAPLVRRRSGEVVTLGQAAGPPLGMIPGQGYDQEELAIGEHDIVLMMTDGIVETLDCDTDRMGESALHELIASAPADIQEINRRILELVASYVGRVVDDVTLVAIEASTVAQRIAA